ncbi:hypothetical protein HK104_005702, partial [Borealophlyctis nickersoniae]
MPSFPAHPPLPIVDITPLRNPACCLDEKAVATAVHHLATAIHHHGAFYVKSADIGGLDRQMRSNVLDAAREVFNVGEEEKRACSAPSSGGGGGRMRGFIGLGDESGSSALEVKEGYSYGDPTTTVNDTSSNSMYAPNIWPSPSAFSTSHRDTLERFFTGMVDVAEAVTRGLSLALGYDEGYLGGFCGVGGKRISLMRLFRYFPAGYEVGNGSGAKSTIGSSPHTDWGFLTLILQQDGVTGLQIANKSGGGGIEWVDVPPIPGTILVNAGDYLSLLTGGKVLSPLHRVVTPEKERLSAVFFYYPSYDAKIPNLDDGNGVLSGLSLFVDQSQERAQDDRDSEPFFEKRADTAALGDD